MLHGCPFEKITFLPKIDTDSGFWKNWDTLWSKSSNGIFITLQIKVFGHKKNKFHVLDGKCHFRNANLALLITCMEFEIFCGQIPSFKVLWICHYYTLSIMYLSLFQIQNLCQFWAKSGFSQKDTHTAFSFLFPSVLLSY